MRRWVPFAIAIFMLTPFALWLGLAAYGPGGGALNLQSHVGTVLLAASLPLAGLFWIQNLRQLGDSMGAPSRLGFAARLAVLLPFAILALGGLGTAWLAAAGAGGAELGLALLGTAVMAGFGWRVARAPIEPGRVVPAPEPAPAGEDRTLLLFLGNLAMALLLLSYYWTPWVLFWTVLALTPVAFALMIALAWWAAKTDVVAAPMDGPAAPANDGTVAEAARAA